MKKYVTFFILFPLFVIGQNTDSLNHNSSNPMIKADKKLDNLIKRHVLLNKDKGLIGWRLQIFSNTDRKKSQKIRSEFLRFFPEIPAYLTHKEPYFKVVVGDFYTKLQAKKVKQKIITKYNSYIVPSIIRVDID
tara:strand:- start:22608 stop:23009 length:402 start_codon:yes stop_codon:yes gene_type:complete